MRIHIGIISGLFLESPETKSHLDVGAKKRHREYYVGEGGGFHHVRVVMSLMNSESPMVYPSIKGALEGELTNLLIGLKHIRMSN